MFGCLPKTNKVILWYNKCGLLAFWCFSICAKEQGSRGQVPHLTLGLWQMLSIKRRFSVFPKHLPGVGAFGKGDASYCVTSFSAARGFRKLTQTFRTDLCSLLECSARSGSAPLQRQWYLQWQGALFLGRGTMIHATVSCAASPRKG